MKHFIRFSIFSITILFIAIFAAKPAFAMEFRSSENDITVQENEMVHGSLFISGKTVEIDGAVEGDLYCAGQTIIVKGPVGGDVICAGQTLQIEGPVDGNVRVAGQTVSIDGTVSRNITAFGQTISTGKESVVNGDAIVGGQSVSILGDIGKSIAGGGNSVLIDGVVGEDATLGGNAIQIGSSAHITGKLTYESNTDAVISGQAVVGEVVKQPLRKEFQNAGKPRMSFPNFAGQPGKPWPVNAVKPILVSIVFGLLAIYLFGNKTTQIITIMKEHAPGSFGVGILWFILFPVVFLLLCVTIIGIPIAVVYAMIFAFVILISKLFVAILIGKELMESFWKDQKENKFLIVLAGAIVVGLLFTMPFVGGLISFTFILWGTGGFVKAFISRKPVKKIGK